MESMTISSREMTAFREAVISKSEGAEITDFSSSWLPMIDGHEDGSKYGYSPIVSIYTDRPRIVFRTLINMGYAVKSMSRVKGKGDVVTVDLHSKSELQELGVMQDGYHSVMFSRLHKLMPGMITSIGMSFTMVDVAGRSIFGMSSKIRIGSLDDFDRLLGFIVSEGIEVESIILTQDDGCQRSFTDNAVEGLIEDMMASDNPSEGSPELTINLFEPSLFKALVKMDDKVDQYPDNKDLFDSLLFKGLGLVQPEGDK